MSADSDSSEKLLKDNKELKDICCYLDDTRQKSKQLAQEWQSFGRYTATVLRDEVLEFETKISILQEKLEKLSQENAELREVCLLLNQMLSTAGPTSTATNHTGNTTGPSKQLQSGPYSVHAACVTEVNATLPKEPPEYMGFTGEARLVDKHKYGSDNEDEEKRKSDQKSYVAQLEQRLERLEQEKLELIKSLSAAHILATSTDESADIPKSPTLDEVEIEPPPNIKSFIDFISDDKDIDQTGNAKIAQQLSADDILKLSTLLDMSRRLDMCTNPDPSEAVEIAALRSLINISWETMKNKHSKKKMSNSSLPVYKPSQTHPHSPTSTQIIANYTNTNTTSSPQQATKENGMVILRTEL